MGLLDSIRGAFTKSSEPAAITELPPAPTPTWDERATEGMLERAFAGFDTGVGSTAMTMLGGKAMSRRGNTDVLRGYSTSPWLRATAGRISSSVASVNWRLYAAPKAMAEQTNEARAAFDSCSRAVRAADRRVFGNALRHADIERGRIALDEYPLELRDMPQGQRAVAIRAMLNDGELVEVTRHPWHRLMAEPNAVMSGRVARQMTIACLDLVGESAWVLGGAKGGAPTHAWPIPGTWIKTRPSPTEPWWTVEIGTGGATATATTWKVPIDALLLFNDPDPVNPYGRGVGIGFTLADEADIDEAAAKTVAAFFNNGCIAPSIVMLKGARKDVLERAKREWNNKLQGFRKAFTSYFTGAEIDVKRVDTPFKDMALPEIRKGQRDIFQQVYGIPPEIMGNNETSSWATSSAADLMMAKHVVVPRCEVQREQYQRLAGYFDGRLVVDYDDPVPVNIENKRAIIVAAPANFRVDEVRAAADEDPVGDESGRGFMVNGTWYGSLSSVAPKIGPEHIAAGIPSLDEARLALRLTAVGGDVGAKATPRSTPAPAFGGFGGPPSPAPVDDPEDEAAPPKKPVDVSAADTEMSAPTSRAQGLTDVQIAKVVRAVDDESMLDAIAPTVARLVKEWGQETLDALGVDGLPGFDEDAARVRAHMRDLGARVRFINATTREALALALENATDTEIENARAPGDMLSLLETAAELVFDMGRDSRAPSIGTTESTLHGGFASTEALVQVKDVVETVQEWSTMGDGAVREAHASIDGQRRALDEDFEVTRGEYSGARAQHPGGFGDVALNANCFMPGTMVEGTFDLAVRSFYEGPAVEIVTKSGRRLRVTPGHPVLTTEGFVPAGELNDGEHVLCHLRDIDPIPALDVHQRPSRIEDVFGALFEMGGLVPVRMRGDDLHGDAKFVDGNVDIVSADRALLRHIDAGCANGVSDVGLMAMDVPLSELARGGLLATLAIRTYSSFSSTPRGVTLSLDEERIGFDGLPLEKLCFAATPELDAAARECGRQSVASDTSRDGNPLQAFSAVVASDEIVEVRKFRASGHVYDLQSNTGIMVADGIVTSNCRCWLVPVKVVAGEESASTIDRAEKDRARGDALRSWEKKIAKAVRDGFDRQQVRVTNALHDALD